MTDAELRALYDATPPDDVGPDLVEALRGYGEPKPCGRAVGLSPDLLEAWRADYGFRPSFDLAGELERAGVLYLESRAAHSATFGERRRLAYKAARQASDLLATLADLARAGGGFMVPRALCALLERFRQKADQAATELQGRGSPTRAPDRGAVALIRSLLQIYQRGTGDPRSYTQSGVTSEYRGPAVRFITGACQAFGADFSNSSVGSTLKKVNAMKRNGVGID